MSAISARRLSLPSLSRAVLVKLKLRALRSEAWFKVLRSAERAFVDATIKVVDHGCNSLRSLALTMWLVG